MKTIQNNKIEKYLMDRMYGKELEDFQTQLQLDSELAQEVEIQRLMLFQIKEMGDLKMREKLKKIKANLVEEEQGQIKNTPTPIKRIRLSPLLVAASILLLIFAGYLNHSVKSSSFSQELYSQNYGAYRLPFNTRSVEVEQALWITAGNFYQEKKYAKAIPLLISLLEQTENSKAQLALGICHMEITEFEKAIQIFTEMKKDKTSRYSDHATWYAAMAYLGIDDLASSKELLNEILKDRDNYFYEQADEILKEMN